MRGRIGRATRKCRQNGKRCQGARAVAKGRGGAKRRRRKVEEVARKSRCGGKGTRKKKMVMRKRDNGCGMHHWRLMGMLQLLAMTYMGSVSIGRGSGDIQQSGILAATVQHMDTLGRTATFQKGMRKKGALSGKPTLDASAIMLVLCRNVDLGRVSRAQWDTVGWCDTSRLSFAVNRTLGRKDEWWYNSKENRKVLGHLGLQVRRTGEREVSSAGSWQEGRHNEKRCATQGSASTGAIGVCGHMA